jgi:hypothetical protein
MRVVRERRSGEKLPGSKSKSGSRSGLDSDADSGGDFDLERCPSPAQGSGADGTEKTRRRTAGALYALLRARGLRVVEYA